MILGIMGIDALDAELMLESAHPNINLGAYSQISTIESTNGKLSTHELWPTIITGLPPTEHGLTLNSGVGWESPLLRFGGALADVILPDQLQSKLGAWILNNTETDVFRTPASYNEQNGLRTLFDGYDAETIGIPNYVTNPDAEDREHELRRRLGDLFERNSDQPGGHSSTDPGAFYEQAMGMVMVRLARTRRAYRSRQFELVFGYTSGVDLIGYIAYNDPQLQDRAYDETNEFVGDLLSDLRADDTLVIVSDHGLQDGIHTHQAMIASTEPRIVEAVDSVVDLRAFSKRSWSTATMSQRQQNPGERPRSTTKAVSSNISKIWATCEWISGGFLCRVTSCKKSSYPAEATEINPCVVVGYSGDVT